MRRRTYSAPMPFGPHSLCAVKDSRSTGRLRTSSGHLARRLGAVGVKGDAALAAHGAKGGDVLQHAGLVVGVHHRDQQRVRTQRGRERRRLQHPAARGREVGDREP